MPDHSSDAALTEPPAGSWDADEPRRTPRRARAPRTDWRLGGRTVLLWREWLLAGALVSLGLGILAGTLIEWLWQSSWAALGATASIWVGMLIPVVWAFSRSRPVGLGKFRALDLLYGVVLGSILRVVQGWTAVMAGDRGGFPSYATVDGALPGTWWFTDLLSVVVIAPVIEELFFHGVVLVALYTVLRRPFGRAISATVAVAVSTGLFVMVHALIAGTGVEVIATGALGLVCGLLVVLTGRIWGAVLVHAVYNSTFVALALIGTIW